MATIQHSALAASERHEPKSLSLSATISNVSSAGTVYVPVPYAGTITKVLSVIDGAIATSDATLTVRDSDSNSMGTLTITQSGSAAGDVDTLTPASNTDVTADDHITIETDGASSNSVSAILTIIMEVT